MFSGPGNSVEVGVCERVIAHLDLDCFYAQVERNRLGLPHDKPIAVQQWGALIAVNYAARAAGVRRMDKITVALQKCPDLVAVHVKTIDCDDASLELLREDARDGVSISEDEAVSSDLPDTTVKSLEGPWRPDRKNAKVSLEPYRKASSDIFKVLVSAVGQPNCEKGGLDEAFLDLTGLVNERIPKDPEGRATLLAEISSPAQYPLADDDPSGPSWCSNAAVTAPLSPAQPSDIRLAVGAKIISDIRRQLFRDLNFTVSAGVSHNKMLSKLLSAQYKPNKQAIVPNSDAQRFMLTVELRKIRSLGGKFGTSLEALGWHTVEDVVKQPLSTLRRHFGEETSLWLYRLVRGIDSSAVVPRTLPKSMLATKNFGYATALEPILPFINGMCIEICGRARAFQEEHGKVPRRLAITFLPPKSGGRVRSKVVPGPVFHSPKALADKVLAVIRGSVDMFPCVNMGLQASDFVDASAGPGISAFFTSASPIAADHRSESSSGCSLDSDSDCCVVEAGANTPIPPMPPRKLALRAVCDEPFTCPVCNRCYADMTALNTHLDYCLDTPVKKSASVPAKRSHTSSAPNVITKFFKRG